MILLQKLSFLRKIFNSLNRTLKLRPPAKSLFLIFNLHCICKSQQGNLRKLIVDENIMRLPIAQEIGGEKQTDYWNNPSLYINMVDDPFRSGMFENYFHCG